MISNRLWGSNLEVRTVRISGRVCDVFDTFTA